MKFTDIFIRRPVLALVVSLLILLIGLKAMTGLQIRQYPRLYNTTITVTTAYPGASPDLIQAQDPIILKSTGQTTAVMYIGFASADLSSAAISDFLTRVVQPLRSTVDGVASADILGGQTFAMRLWLHPARMAARGISATEVAAAIRANNYQSAPGQAKGYFTITNVNADTGLADVQQFNKMVVKAKDGAVVRMEDIATV